MTSVFRIIIVLEFGSDYEKEAKQVMKKLREKGFSEFTYTHGTNVLQVSMKHKFIIRKAIEAIQEAGDFDFYLIIPDEIVEVTEAIENHEYFKAFTLCVALYESFGKNILIEHFKGQLSLNSDHIERLGIHSVILLLYTNGLIKEGTYSDMISVNDTRNKMIHQYMSSFMEQKFVISVEEDAKKISRSLRKLKEINDVLIKR